MSLSRGARLGPYEIIGPLGAGGMGEVYRAHDSRLNRDVAIKTLPAAFANDPARMARFQREAQVLAALNHPHIAAIYGIEQSALVMELVDGHNLAGPVSVDEAIAIARQIADALDAAHQKNIVHRDLKPANIKITPDGSVKVLDFGLAKALDGNSSSANPENSSTLSMESTQAGMILGTAGYMSPEQARGKAVDKRADIWSFGVVFYELLTGHRAFEGETTSDTLASVLKSDPDWKRLPAATPVGIRRLLERCLQRDPNKRLRDIGDAWNDMDGTAESGTSPRAKRFWIPWAVALLAVVGVAIWGWSRVPAAPSRSVTRSVMPFANFAITPALSHDGTRLAYTEMLDGIPHLSMRMMDQLDGMAIAGVNGAAPAFSPDGQWIAYVSFPPPSKLNKIPTNGGTSTTLCDLPGAFPAQGSPSWGEDDAILFGSTKGLMRVPATGGTPQLLTMVNTKNGELNHGWPELLPGGRTILFTIGTGESTDASRIALLDLKTGVTRVLVNGGDAGRYVPSGHLVYVRGGTVFAVPFDLGRLEVTGSETPVVEGIFSTFYTFSDSSVLVFLAKTRDKVPSRLEWTDRTGAAQPLPELPQRWGAIAVSPNGKLIAGSIRGDANVAFNKDPSDIWIYDVERRTLARLTFEGLVYQPVWTPDGKWVTFSSRHDGKYGIYRVAADKSGKPELLVSTGEARALPTSWTPDGKTLLYCQYAPDRRLHSWILPPPGSGGENKPRMLSQTSFNEENPQVSPDGKWLAYGSDESGKYEAYVVPFPGPGGKSQISTQGGRFPVWSRSGRELFYVEPGTNQLMAVDVSAGPQFRAGQSHALFKLTGSIADLMFDVTPDPKRFLVARVPEGTVTSTFVTITDWFDDLRRRAPVKKVGGR